MVTSRLDSLQLFKFVSRSSVCQIRENIPIHLRENPLHTRYYSTYMRPHTIGHHTSLNHKLLVHWLLLDSLNTIGPKCTSHCKPKPCKAYRELPVSQFPQGKTCFHYRGTLFSLQGPCFHYRVFPVLPCKGLQWGEGGISPLIVYHVTKSVRNRVKLYVQFPIAMEIG